MSVLREEVLIKSLKNVSLQRLRYLKMDMDRLAKDSRIQDENSFWSALEFHDINLDERTRREFGQIIIDNRGVNIEIALRHLKKAQRQTGRDSVEVLPKEPEKPVSTKTKLAPPATTITEFKPPVSPGKRNYKLDRLRTKALGIGKLSVAFRKSGTTTPGQKQPLKATGDGKLEPATSSEKTEKNAENAAKQEPNKPQTDETNPPKKPSTEEKAPLLKVLLQQSLSSDQNSTSDEKQLPSQEQKDDGDKAQSPTPDLNKDEGGDKDDTNGDKRPSLDESELKRITEKYTEKKQNQPEDSPKDNENEKDKLPVPDESGNATDVNDQDGKIKNNNFEDQRTPEVKKDAESNADPEKQTQLLKQDQLQDESKESIDRETDQDKNTKTQEDQPSGTDEQPPDTQKHQSDDEEKPSDTLDHSLAKIDDVTTEFVNRQKSNSEENLQGDFTSDEANPVPSENDDPNHNVPSSDLVDDKTEDPQDADHKIVTEDDVTPSNDNATEGGFEEGDACLIPGNETEEPDDNDLSGEKSELKLKAHFEQESESAESSPRGDIRDPKQQKQESIKKQKRRKREKKKAPVSPETQSNTDEQNPDEKEQNSPEENQNDQPLIPDNSSLTGESSGDEAGEFFGPSVVRSVKVHVGATEVELFDTSEVGLQDFPAPVDMSQVDLSIEWVYGCNTKVAQCMTSNASEELIYFSGRIVIIYNHLRKTQRHYLEHSGMVTSIACHVSEPRIASAQLSSAVQAATCDGPSARAGFGQVHVRIWNSDTMETITVLGLGLLRCPVLKMQFLDFQDHFVTLENDDSCTMTLWRGGCKVTCRTTVLETKAPEAPSAKSNTSKHEIKRPKTSGKRETNASIKPQEKNQPAVKLSVNPNGPRCVGAINTGEGQFVTAGKLQLQLWRLLDEYDDEYVQGEGEGTQLSLPVTGDVGKHFFKAEFFSCSYSTDHFSDGSLLTGDSNGTLLLWSEESKTPTRGFAHAHECHLSAVCVNDDGIIFTSGSRDRTVKAFACRKSKLECCGQVKLPPGFGSATCLATVSKTLFVATDNNAILAIGVGLEQQEASYGAGQSQKMMHKRSQSTHSLKNKVSDFKLPPEEQQPERKPSLFSSWEDTEVARSVGKREIVVAKMDAMTSKKRKMRGTQNLRAYRESLSKAQANEEVKTPMRHLAKSAGIRRKVYDKSPSYAWKTPEEIFNLHDSRNAITSYPRLRAHERILLREKTRSEEPAKPIEPCAVENAVKCLDVFYNEDLLSHDERSLFVAASDDGWLVLYNAKDHSIVGRCKVPELSGVTCLDTCARRELVAVGTAGGKVTVARINKTAFELFAPVACACSRGGNSRINQIRFSPDGCKLAVSVGYEVIIYSDIGRDQVVEWGRCSDAGHQSQFITGLDWSTKKFRGAYFLRTSSIKQEIETKFWNTKIMQATDPNDLPPISWASVSSPLDYGLQGMWSEFDEHSYSAHDLGDFPRKPGSVVDRGSSGQLVWVGDAQGKLTASVIPGASMSMTCTYRGHISRITQLRSTSDKLRFLTAAENDASLIQWKAGHA